MGNAEGAGPKPASSDERQKNMSRTLTLKVAQHRDGGLALSVTHTHRVGDEDNSLTTTEKLSDDMGSDTAIKTAVSRAVEEYLGRLRKDSAELVSESPIGKAARG